MKMRNKLAVSNVFSVFIFYSIGPLRPTGNREVSASLTILINLIDRIAITICKKVMSGHVFIQGKVCIDKTAYARLIISTPEIIESSFFIVDITAVAEGLDGAQGGGKRAGRGKNLAPGIVNIFYHFIVSAVNDTDNIPLQIVQIGILCAVELNVGG